MVARSSTWPSLARGLLMFPATATNADYAEDLAMRRYGT